MPSLDVNCLSAGRTPSTFIAWRAIFGAVLAAIKSFCFICHWNQFGVPIPLPIGERTGNFIAPVESMAVFESTFQWIRNSVDP
jgi:hypothetical protein